MRHQLQITLKDFGTKYEKDFNEKAEWIKKVENDSANRQEQQ